ncbi:MAG: diguanylate cyclase [Deltaproteobacteria bacterium]|nr:diguanylate cyclase [Deltaproteobacteria bacterium]
MKICFPVKENNGLQSRIYGHFGSAPMFVVVEEGTGGSSEPEVEIVQNGNMNHVHGQCSPVRALGGTSVDCIVVGGIGGGALNKLSSMGIRVFRAQGGTIGKNLDLLREDQLKPIDPSMTCTGHDHGGGCAH